MEFGTAGLSIEDRLNRVARLKGNLNDNGADAYYVTYGYTSGGRVVRTFYDTPALAGQYDADGNGTYEFLDGFGRIVTRDWRVGASLRDQVTYTYDFAGNRLSRDIPTSLYATNDQDQAYTYDCGHRLLHVDQGTWNGTSITSKKFAQHWTLDGLGNWDNGPSQSGFQQDNDGNGTYDLNQIRTHNKANETLTASSWASPVHDAAGNMTTIPQPATPASSYALKYDAWNRLVQVNTGSVATYEYDGLGRRIAKVSGGVTEDYYYNTNYQIIEVRRGGVMREQLVWNVDYIDSLALRFNDGNSDGDFLDANEQHYVLQDGNYNVTALADTAGAVFERYRYTPYGERKVLEANFTDDPDAISDVLNPYTYTGRQFDSETGLYYYRARYYHAQLGRFVSRDPIGYYGRVNLYGAYFVPNGVDPFGLDETISTFGYFWSCYYRTLKGSGCGGAASTISDFVPVVSGVKGCQEALTGTNVLTGEPLGVGDRVISGMGVVPGGKWVGKGGKWVFVVSTIGCKKVGKWVFRHGDDVFEHADEIIKAPNSALRQTGSGFFSGSADEAYNAIRASSSDVASIAQNTGIKPANIQKVKDHLFHQEHLMDRYVDLGVPAEMRRFDSDLGIANAWKRLEQGTHTPADLQLLRHEAAEAHLMRRWADPSYSRAHNRAQQRFPAPPLD
jgi:RHS repeat-associated protein